MGWTQVPDRADGDVFTASMWNTYIRDNFNSGVAVILADEVLGAPATEFDLLDINQDFRHLELLLVGRSTSNLGTIQGSNVRFNGDSGANYDCQSFDGNGGSIGATFSAGQTACINLFLGTNAAATLWGASRIFIPNYTDTDKDKIALGYCATKVGTTSGAMFVRHAIDAWRSTAAINRITWQPHSSLSLAAGSRMTLVGYP